MSYSNLRNFYLLKNFLKFDVQKIESEMDVVLSGREIVSFNK